MPSGLYQEDAEGSKEAVSVVPETFKAITTPIVAAGPTATPIPQDAFQPVSMLLSSNMLSSTENYLKPRVIVILEAACLELTQGKNKVFQLLNSIDHRSALQKKSIPPEDIRPDITHQCLMTLLDSPLNKAGLLSVYIRSTAKQLIHVSPQLLVPRTWKQFNDMMVTFLQKHKIKAVEKNTPLLQIIKNDLSAVLPAGGRKIGLSVSGKKVNLRDYIAKDTESTAAATYVIGAVAHADPALQCDFVEECVCISSFSLTAAVCCSKICAEYEYLYNVF